MTTETAKIITFPTIAFPDLEWASRAPEAAQPPAAAREDALRLMVDEGLLTEEQAETVVRMERSQMGRDRPVEA